MKSLRTFPHPLLAIDTETGGTLPSKHALLSIAAHLKLPYAKEPGYSFNRYILPAEGKQIDPEAAAINGYSPEAWRLLGAVPLAQAMSDFDVFLNDMIAQHPTARLLAHNAGFDRGFLEEAASMTGIKLPIRHAWRCSMDKFGTLVDRGLLPEGTLRLERLASLAEVENPHAHNALNDALTCLQSYLWLLDVEESYYHA